MIKLFWEYVLFLLLIFKLFAPILSSGTNSKRKILFTWAPRSKSHFLSAKPFIQRLVSDGHNVHLLNIVGNLDEAEIAKKQLNSSSIKFHTVILSPNVTLNEQNAKMNTTQIVQNLIWNKTMHSPSLALIYQQRANLFSNLLEYHADQLVAMLNSKWDLIVISELFNIHGYGIAQLVHGHAKTPYIIFCTSIMLSSTVYSRGIGANWVTSPNRFSPVPMHPFDGFRPTKYSNRLLNVVEALLDLASSYYIDQIAIGPRLSMLTGPGNHFSFAKLHSQSALTIMDTISYLGLPKPDLMGIINLGAHCEQILPLENEIKDFVNDPNSNGTIFMAMGTFVSFDMAPPYFLNTFLEAFKNLPEYRFVVSLPNYRNLPKFNNFLQSAEVPSNIRLVKWAPQLNLLAHKKTKLFITHCGLKSIKEAICTGKPMLAIPMYAEQNHNAKMIYEYGVGLLLNKFSIESNTLQLLIKHMLNNSTYIERAKQMEKIFRDVPTKIFDSFSFQINKTLKANLFTQKFAHFMGKELNFISYFHIDLIFLIFLFIRVLSRI